jgi:hypothetical protein
MRDRPLLVVAARLRADVIDGFLDDLKNSNAALFSSASDKSAEETARETFLNLISRFAPAARTPIPLQPAPQPSSRHVKAPSLKRGRAQSTRVVSMPLVRRRSLSPSGVSSLGPARMSRRASRPSSTFFLPHQTKPKALL